MISIISQCSINPLTPGAFCQKSIFGYFGDFSASIWAELASIYYSKRHLQHDSMPFFPLELHFTTVLLRHVQKSPTWPMSLWFFFFIFAFPFFSISYLFAAVIDLLLGLPDSEFSEKASLRHAFFFSVEYGSVVAGNFAASFSLKFLGISVPMSRSIKPMTLIWVSLGRLFPLVEQFWSNVMTSEVEQRPTLVTGGLLPARESVG